jgi:hypothetical protein
MPFSNTHVASHDTFLTLLNRTNDVIDVLGAVPTNAFTIQHVRVIIPHADILTLSSVPVTLVPAVANSVILPIGWTGEGYTNANAYTVTLAALLGLVYSPDIGKVIYTDVLQAGSPDGTLPALLAPAGKFFLAALTGALYSTDAMLDSSNQGNYGAPLSSILGFPLQCRLLNPDETPGVANPTGGNVANRLVINVWYVVVPIL